MRRPIVPAISLALVAIPATARAQVRQTPIVRPAVAAPIGRVAITLPDGSILAGATNQILLFFKGDATASDQQAVKAAAAALGGQVVGELTAARVLQIQVSNPANVGSV